MRKPYIYFVQFKGDQVSCEPIRSNIDSFLTDKYGSSRFYLIKHFAVLRDDFLVHTVYRFPCGCHVQNGACFNLSGKLYSFSSSDVLGYIILSHTWDLITSFINNHLAFPELEISFL